MYYEHYSRKEDTGEDMAKFYLCFIFLLIHIYVHAGITRGRAPRIHVCALPKIVGPSVAPKTRYYYDSVSQLCEPFVWGGLFSNGNNFVTKRRCLKRCGCRAPKKTGFCLALFYRFYYNTLTGNCHRFVYGGCGANANNFPTRRECRRTCRSIFPRFTIG